MVGYSKKSIEKEHQFTVIRFFFCQKTLNLDLFQHESFKSIKEHFWQKIKEIKKC